MSDERWKELAEWKRDCPHKSWHEDECEEVAAEMDRLREENGKLREERDDLRAVGFDVLDWLTAFSFIALSKEAIRVANVENWEPLIADLRDALRARVEPQPPTPDRPEEGTAAPAN
jgi:hypothetical protein